MHPHTSDGTTAVSNVNLVLYHTAHARSQGLTRSEQVADVMGQERGHTLPV